MWSHQVKTGRGEWKRQSGAPTAAEQIAGKVDTTRRVGPTHSPFPVSRAHSSTQVVGTTDPGVYGSQALRRTCRFSSVPRSLASPARSSRRLLGRRRRGERWQRRSSTGNRNRFASRVESGIRLRPQEHPRDEALVASGRQYRRYEGRCEPIQYECEENCQQRATVRRPLIAAARPRRSFFTKTKTTREKKVLHTRNSALPFHLFSCKHEKSNDGLLHGRDGRALGRLPRGEEHPLRAFFLPRQGARANIWAAVSLSRLRSKSRLFAPPLSFSHLIANQTQRCGYTHVDKLKNANGRRMLQANCISLKKLTPDYDDLAEEVRYAARRPPRRERDGERWGGQRASERASEPASQPACNTTNPLSVFSKIKTQLRTTP